MCAVCMCGGYAALTNVVRPEEDLLVAPVGEHLEREVVDAAIRRAEVERLETENVDEGGLDLLELCDGQGARRETLPVDAKRTGQFVSSGARDSSSRGDKRDKGVRGGGRWKAQQQQSREQE